jgi:hypothetical protein
MNRWSIYIDVEEFSGIYRRRQGRAIQALGKLMEALFLVASKKFSTAPERLFIHQFGDGFVVVSDFIEPNPQRPIAICLAAMRHLIGKGVATKAAISEATSQISLAVIPKRCWLRDRIRVRWILERA